MLAATSPNPTQPLLVYLQLTPRGSLHPLLGKYDNRKVLPP